MKNSIVLFLILMSTMCFGQIEWEWAYDNDFKFTDEAHQLALDEEGNVYSLVRFTKDTLFIGNDTLIAPSSGMQTGFLMKQSSEGELLWVRQITCSIVIYCTALCIDKDGFVYVASSFYGDVSIGDTTFSSDSYYDLLIVKYDDVGNVADIYTYPPGIGVTSICINNDNEIYLSGSYRSDFTLGDFSLTYVSEDSGSADIYLAKIDDEGNIVWVESINGNSQEFLYDMACDTIGNIYLLGKFYSEEINCGEYTLYNSVSDRTTYDIYIIRFDDNGNAIWVESINSPLNETGESIFVDKENNIYITGVFDGENLNINGTEIIGGSACTNTFIFKFDSIYNIIWSKGFGPQGNNAGKAIAVDQLGNTYVAGTYANTINYNEFSITSEGASDIYILKFNVSGDITDICTIGGEEHDIPNKIAIDNNDRCILAGYFRSSTFSIGDLELYNDSIEYADFFISKFYSPTITNLAKNEISHTIFPNPTSNSFTISIENAPIDVQIYDINGKLIKSVNYYTGEKIDASNFAKGVYFVKLSNDIEVSIDKLVIE